MATFNFHGDNTVHGIQNIAARDMTIVDRTGMTEILAALLSATRQSISVGSVAQAPGDEACAELSAAIAALAQPGDDAPQKAQLSLTRARDILTTAALVPGLAEGIAKAVEAIRGLC
jgi:hypothetical protein